MNRTGLFIALALALVIGIVFGIFPELDLKLAALFYDARTRSFPLKLDGWASFARDAAMWISWAIALDNRPTAASFSSASKRSSARSSCPRLSASFISRCSS